MTRLLVLYNQPADTSASAPRKDLTTSRFRKTFCLGTVDNAAPLALSS
jgi:hypothetical protein